MTQSTLLELLSNDLYQLILSFLSIPDLATLDLCCTDIRERNLLTWIQLDYKNDSSLTANSTVMAQAALAEQLPSFSSPKLRVSRLSVARQFVNKMEGLYHQTFHQNGNNDDNNTTTGTTTTTTTTTNNNKSNTDSTAQKNCDEFPDLDFAFHHEPSAFLGFVRLSFFHNVNEKSKERYTLWEGFSNAVDQGAWGDSSTIVFMPLRDINNQVQWTPAFKELFSLQQQQKQHADNGQWRQSSMDDVNDEVFQTALHKAFDGLHLTIISFPIETFSTARPRLVLATDGIHFATRDNRCYYHMQSRLGQMQHGITPTSSESPLQPVFEVFPRLVMSVPLVGEKSSHLLGIRLVTNGGEMM